MTAIRSLDGVSQDSLFEVFKEACKVLRETQRRSESVTIKN
jgi:hypothetical protein